MKLIKTRTQYIELMHLFHAHLRKYNKGSRADKLRLRPRIDEIGEALKLYDIRNKPT